MAKTAEDYKSYLNTSQVSSAMTSGVTWAAALGAINPVLGVLGWIGGALFGAWSGDSAARETLRNDRNSYLEARNTAQQNIATQVTLAKSEIATTRNKIDSTYGAGTFDLYDDLFAQIFDLPENSSTLNDIFENASVDKYYGKRTQDLSGSYDLSQGPQVMSLSDISDGYREYLTSLIRGGDTSIGLSFRRRNLQERNLMESYYADVDSYRLQMAESFKNAFLNRVSEQTAGEQAMGDASVAQATSGIRQQAGGGTNLTMQQQFQNDLASIAYASSLDYAVRQYESYMTNMNKSLSASVEDIRIQNSMDSKEAINAIINAYNEQNKSNWSSMVGIVDNEKIYDEADAEIDSITEALGDTFKPDMEEIFA